MDSFTEYFNGLVDMVGVHWAKFTVNMMYQEAYRCRKFDTKAWYVFNRELRVRDLSVTMVNHKIILFKRKYRRDAKCH